MSNKTDVKETLKMEKAKLHDEISSTKKSFIDYKIERKANWKQFKAKMNDDVSKIEKSILKLTTHNKK